MKSLITHTVPDLTPVSLETRQYIIDGEKTAYEHVRWMQLPCMQSIEVGGQGDLTQLGDTLRVMAWNIERCLDVEGSAALLKAHQPDVVLLSEMDNGMARTQQRHTTRELAEQLGMYYAFGVEFLELDLGAVQEIAFATDDFNEHGWHGNALLSRAPLSQVALLRYDDEGYWFAGKNINGNVEQSRVGGRIALTASISTEQGDVTFASTHFESHSDSKAALIARRAEQMHMTLDACETFGNDKVIIGGDLNSKYGEEETLFQTATDAGYHWRANSEGVTTRVSRLNSANQTDASQRQKQLDWFCAKGIDASNVAIMPALDDNGIALSDHEAIFAEWIMR